jgi:hypothetical protein
VDGAPKPSRGVWEHIDGVCGGRATTKLRGLGPPSPKVFQKKKLKFIPNFLFFILVLLPKFFFFFFFQFDPLKLQKLALPLGVWRHLEAREGS